MSARPRFEPTPCIGPTDNPTLGESWTPLISAPADFPPDIFEAATAQLVHHPEYNSTLILRSELIEETVSNFPLLVPVFKAADLQPVRNIHRRLLPRRPGRDEPLDQHCTFYGSQTAPNTLILTPVVPDSSAMPYYHPPVSHLAFRYLKTSPPTLRVEVVLLSSNVPIDPNSRLYRTALALLDTVHRYGWGTATNYQKRVNHDRVVPREAYQDLYLVMREKFKGMVDTWAESTDPLKHVFEDIGIATFLILLWKDTFPSVEEGSSLNEPWKGWGRPPSGFLDFGCGNGLLTHILVSCGYPGFGVDLRARVSWEAYPAETRAHLRVGAFTPDVLHISSPENPFASPPGVFIIANHADELTPWTPLLATRVGASGFLNIPCCPWAFDAKFERGKATAGFKAPLEDADLSEVFNLGPEGNTSAYGKYRTWIGQLSQHCGWDVECEMLRIPSTRNWALIGRKRFENRSQAATNVDAITQVVGDRGLFKARKPEGKAGRGH
ncbi:unnamed protein product [Mycena citricolor]|uniref:tRNA (uracil-O(2)-)-methyltransferase n=2 Tax=Mycena citricolor TaxID=2018698 RepID=A0AAD2HK19_9AGAR|nr:unnamed protein product [Mycena citricolor]